MNELLASTILDMNDCWCRRCRRPRGCAVNVLVVADPVIIVISVAPSLSCSSSTPRVADVVAAVASALAVGGLAVAATVGLSAFVGREGNQHPCSIITVKIGITARTCYCYAANCTVLLLGLSSFAYNAAARTRRPLDSLPLRTEQTLTRR